MDLFLCSSIQDLKLVFNKFKTLMVNNPELKSAGRLTGSSRGCIFSGLTFKMLKLLKFEVTTRARHNWLRSYLRNRGIGRLRLCVTERNR